ncbi:MAG: amidohydrolase family protein [Bacilli bacterium]
MNKKYLLIKNVNLVDVEKERIINNVDILVKEGKIADINKNIIDKNAKEINLKNMYIMPGLINLHAHLFGTGMPSKNLTGGASQARTLKLIKTKVGDKILNKLVKKSLLTELYSGTTTVRSVGDFYYSDCKQRDLINSGKYVGPTLYCSGFAITAPGGHGDGTFARSGATKEELEKLIDNNIAHKVDWIKICTTGGVMDAKEVGGCGALKMSPEQTAWCISYAHKKGYRVASHTEGSEGMIVGIANDLDTIEHGAIIKDDEFKAKYLPKDKKITSTLITTISPAIPFAKFNKELTKCDDIQKSNADIVANGIIETSKLALKEGIRVGLGTDASCPFAFQYGMWRELAYFKKYVGVTASFAVKTATLINAQILGKEKEVGSLDKGKYFDAVVTSKDPYSDLKTLENPYCVFKKGILIKKKPKKFKKYDELLDKLL